MVSLDERFSVESSLLHEFRVKVITHLCQVQLCQKNHQIDSVLEIARSPQG